MASTNSSSAKTDETPATRRSQHVAVDEKELTPEDVLPSPPYTVLSEREKISNIILCSAVTFLSPVAANMYYPALGPLARDMNVSQSTINLTITVFKVIRDFHCS